MRETIKFYTLSDDDDDDNDGDDDIRFQPGGAPGLWQTLTAVRKISSIVFIEMGAKLRGRAPGQNKHDERRMRMLRARIFLVALLFIQI